MMSDFSEICIYSTIGASVLLRLVARTVGSNTLNAIGTKGFIIGMTVAGVHTLEIAPVLGVTYALSGPIARADTAKLVINLMIPVSLHLCKAPLVLTPWIFTSSASLFCMIIARITGSHWWGFTTAALHAVAMMISIPAALGM